MKLIAEFTDKSVHQLDLDLKNHRYYLRKAVRCILLDSDKKLALLYAQKGNYYKLPGGGIEKGETKEQALNREVIEETGYEMEIKNEFGVTIEYKFYPNDTIGEIQTSYLYLAHAKKIVQEPVFTDEEKKHSFKLLWLEKENIIDKMKPIDNLSYENKFIAERDFEIVNYYLKTNYS